MDRRSELQIILENLLGSRNVYFQPPPSVSMIYPAIVYSRTNIDTVYANNLAYAQKLAYKVTVIDRDPDSEIVKKVAMLPLCSFDQHYASDNLNHDVFTIYY